MSVECSSEGLILDMGIYSLGTNAGWSFAPMNPNFLSDT